MEVMARLPGCHVCYGKDHFLIDCPLLSTEVRQRIAVQRAQQIQQDRGGNTAGGGEPSLRAPYAQPSTNGLPTRLPRRGDHVRVTLVVVVLNKHQQWLVMCSKTNPDPPKRSYK